MFEESGHNNLPVQDISIEVLLEKYAKGDEKTPQDVRRRVAKALASVELPENQEHYEKEFLAAQENGFIPAGRIASAAGTNLKATLVNCFVQPVGDSISETDEDGFPGIYTALQEAAETMRRGGGVGYDFSRIRPSGAWVGSTESSASGPVSYMRVFDRSCETVESAGARRGAQMGVLRCDHPDIEAFIHAKDTGDLKNFNISVAVSDHFMEQVSSNGMIELIHKAEPGQKLKAAGAYQRDDGLWVYQEIAAMSLWDQIMQSTYDHAEPGILFMDRINKDNNLYYCESITATNPCVTADTRLATQYGLITIGELYRNASELLVTVDNRALQTDTRGVSVRGAVPAFMTSQLAEVFRVKTVDGYEIKATAWHDFYTTRGKLKLSELKPDDELLIQSGTGQFGTQGSEDLGMLMGLIAGDGHFTNKGLGKIAVVLGFWGAKKGMVERTLTYANELIKNKAKNNRDYTLTTCDVEDRDVTIMTSTVLATELEQYGFNKETKLKVPDVVWKGTKDCVRGYISALFQTDGTVNVSVSSNSCSVRLTSVNKDFLKEIQILLANFGVFCRIHKRKDAGEKMMPDGRGGRKLYQCQTLYEIIVDGESRERFMQQIGFILEDKNGKYQNWVKDKALLKTQRFTSKIKSITSYGFESVYDTTQEDHNTVIFNGIVTGQCGEQPLPPYGCCDLGSINLTKFVREPFSANSYFDYEGFASVCATAVRMLDNVLDLTVWPLKKQEKESQSKRRVGLGFTGLGDTLIMLGKDYSDIEARIVARDISEKMRDAAYLASIELAKEHGAFPLFDAEKYLEGGNFASRLPETIKGDIRKYGIRNSHLLSIAPTGTISLAFADNASNGIEPAFSWTYNRKKREADGSHKVYSVEDHAWRLYKSIFGKDAKLPPSFVSALEISAESHELMVAAVAPYIDTAISKTVNVPADYPYVDFKDLYLLAWKSGLKGLATYRPNSILGSVLSVDTPAPAAQEEPEEKQALEDVNPLTVSFDKREEGELTGVTLKMNYSSYDGVRSAYLTVNFQNVTGVVNGKEVTIERPVEFFLTSGQVNESLQWVSSNMRSLSLMARCGGPIAKVLANMRKEVWDRGPVRYGWLNKEDGTRAPVFHSSEVAVIGYAFQRILINRGFLTETGEQVNVEKLIASFSNKKDSAPATMKEKEQEATPGPVLYGTGKVCPECGAHELHKVDGCSRCTNCNYVGSCG
jgi:ribonucleoside-diphosphate reductase alpha chain